MEDKDICLDIEVFAYDWVVDFCDDANNHTTFHNDYDGILGYMTNEDVYYGFNIKHYDRYILNAILNRKSPEWVKALNDDIIKYGVRGWESEYSKGCYAKYNFYDLMDDTQTGMSLKSFEAHTHRNIVESTVDFDIDHVLTDKELEEVIYYVRQDTEATVELKKHRGAYLNTKVSLGARCGLDRVESLYLTNAKLTAKYLGARKRTFHDEREYVFPSNIDYKYIPTEVLNFFKRIHDKSIPDDELFHSEYEFYLGECKCKVAFGGIHGAIEGYKEFATEEREILNKDGDSFYPNIDRVYHYTSRCMADPNKYVSVIKERIAAKKSGDKQRASDLKLVVNTTYGCKGDRYNDLYDPLMMRSTCITGQLLLLWLANMLYTECKTVKVIQVNTDGVMISADKSERPLIEKLSEKWVEASGITLETDNISGVVQRDVNNYIEIQTDGSLKCKGGELVRGVSIVGAFSVNNQAPIISKAMINYFVKGTKVEETINNSTLKEDFQLICKASHKYDGAYHEVDGDLIPVQMCNRVYATSNKRYGLLYKTQNGSIQKQVAGTQKLPEHCVIDNDNKLGIDEIFRQWYIDIATLKIMKFQKENEKVIEYYEEFLREVRE